MRQLLEETVPSFSKLPELTTAGGEEGLLDLQAYRTGGEPGPIHVRCVAWASRCPSEPGVSYP